MRYSSGGILDGLAQQPSTTAAAATADYQSRYYTQLQEGLRVVGRPKLRYKVTIKRNLKDKHISISRAKPIKAKKALERIHSQEVIIKHDVQPMMMGDDCHYVNS